jgi:hypothetical protein
MFQVLEKDGKLQPVHSRGDLEYMQRRGWSVRPEVAVARLVQPVAQVAPDALPKRKYTKRAK